jgi:hypothetical protein
MISNDWKTRTLMVSCVATVPGALIHDFEDWCLGRLDSRHEDRLDHHRSQWWSTGGV